MKTTRYFKEKVLVKRPYIKLEWVEEILKNPVKREIQPEGRVKYWGYIHELQKYLRVVTFG